MKAFMEKFSLLSLSLMLVSTFAVSPALPKMLSFYQTRGYSNKKKKERRERKKERKAK